jgi:signal transduction histidine kinase
MWVRPFPFSGLHCHRCLLCLLVWLSGGFWEVHGAGTGEWLGWFSGELRQIQRSLRETQTELDALRIPVVGQTVPQFGYLHPLSASPPPVSPFVQVDLGGSYPLDWIALIPAQVDWQTLERPSYGFPLRFRIDASEDENFATFSALGIFTENDFPNPGIAPVTIAAEGKTGRFVRVTITKMAREDGRYLFALGELMVLSGNRNLANGAPVRASATTHFPPRWALENLVDGRSALGPPIQRELLPYDGLYSGPAPAGQNPWMLLDLGRAVAVEEVRLHPIHARLGADIPGFSFPKNLRVELAAEADFLDPLELVGTQAGELPNPGNNPVTLRAGGRVARYVRMTMIEPLHGTKSRYGFSEVEVYSGGNNVARGARVSAVPDSSNWSRTWPLEQLVDGYTSYGKLMELPAWLQQWSRRAHLQQKLARLGIQREVCQARVQARLWRVGVVGLATVVLGGLGAVTFLRMQARRRREAELHTLRTQFAHDLHDEIGSNLAAISVISQMARRQTESGDTGNWEEIQSIARDSNEALHEVLWVSGARQEEGVDLLEQLKKAARRMLAGRVVRWIDSTPVVSSQWSLESRRQVFLFFKETLANVVRHSSATEVELALESRAGKIQLRVRDNGTGFAGVEGGGTGVQSLQERARTLGGTCYIHSQPGLGTTVELEVPVPTTNWRTHK